MPAEGKDLLQIGRVLKANGTDGEAVISLYGFLPDELNLTEPVFIYFDGSPVPFFVESISGRGTRKALVRLTGMHSAEDVGEIVGSDVYAEPTALPEVGKDDDFSFLVGWSVYDGNVPSASDENHEAVPYEKVGEIIDFSPIPGNPCIEVGTKKGAVLVPLHEDLIIFLEENSRTIVMDLPDGLL